MISKPFFKKKRFLFPVLVILGGIFLDIVIVSLTHGESRPVGIVHLDNPIADLASDQIRVMTINMAHGRADGRNQMLVPNAAIKENVDKIGRLIARENVQVVGMQEADAPSWWSGRFSHVNRVGEIGGMTSAVQGRNIDGLGLHYGSAVVTQLEVFQAREVTFEMNLPTFSKGFVVVTCTWPGDPGFEFDVVSLHLDFASSEVRSSQISILLDLVKQTDRPVILMGDFNTDMSGELLPAFIKESGLRTWRVNDASIVTFPVLGSRIDWIFASPELRIVNQRVLDDVLSRWLLNVAVELLRSKCLVSRLSTIYVTAKIARKEPAVLSASLRISRMIML